MNVSFTRRQFLALGSSLLTLNSIRVMEQIPVESSRVHEKAAVDHVFSEDGTRIGYVRSGSGPPLLLVHGTTADHTRWVGISPALEESFTVYAMDRRGRGASSDAEDYSIEREFEDVAAVIDAIEEPVNVLGHSYGANCCIEGAVLTNNVRRLILYEPDVPIGSALYSPELPERMQALVDEGEWEAAVEILFREVVKMPEHDFEVYRNLPVWQVRISLAPTIPRELVAIEAYRFKAETFANFRVPTMLLLGGDSPQVVREGTEMLDAALPNSRIAILPGQQHVAMDTAPDLFLKEVMHFLEG